ncbi:hypothetical protein ACFL50_02230 [Candidatus Latescibacterota bacterium]
MKKIILNLVVTFLIVISCSHFSRNPIKASIIKDISGKNISNSITPDNADSILTRYSIEFTIPNPLYGDDRGIGQFDPNHASTINCRAILLDDFSSEADIIVQSKTDSLDENGIEEFRSEYYEKYVRDGMFRIEIEMESGFSYKSIDSKLWAMYLENTDGVMIEPFEIETTIVNANEDSVFSKYYQRNFARKLLKGEISLYFKKQTFFGEDLLGGDNPYIVLVISRNKKTVARVAWQVAKENKP